MAESFDPYHIWLGIPPAEQPADHYRLLGISRFESNLDVIGNAADQRVRHIRTMQTGKRQAESQRLLNEIAAASGILLDSVRREEYDAQLKAQAALRHPDANRTLIVATSVPHLAPLSIPSLSDLELPASTPLPRALPQPTYAAAYRPAADSSTKFPLVPIVAVTVGALVLVVIVGVVLSALNRKEPGVAVAPSQLNPTKQPEQSPPIVPPKEEAAKPETIAPEVTTPEPALPPAEAEVPKPPPPPEKIEPPEINFATKDGKSLTVRLTEKSDLLAKERTMIKGELSARSGSPGAFTGGNDPDRAEIQFALPSVYLIESKLTRLRGEDTIIFGIMVGGHPTSLVIDGYSGIGPWSGLELVGGQRITESGQATAVRGKQFTNGERSTLRVLVLSNRVIAELEDRRIVDWLGDPATLERDPGHATPHAENLSLTTWGSVYQVESLDLYEIEVIERSATR